MRRRARIDLGQQTTDKEEKRLDRKRLRWSQVNKNSDPTENPFIEAIRPGLKNYGDPNETIDDLQNRLNNFEFGNFPGYFNYRNKSTKDSDDVSDERLGHLKEDWFKNKIVLDIGCNRGHITYAISRQFSPKFIVGIDIDAKIISMANKDLHLHLEDGLIKPSNDLRLKEISQYCLTDNQNPEVEQNPSSQSSCDQYPILNYVNSGPIASSKLVEGCQFPNNLIFVEHNYVPSNDELVSRQKSHFDTIICLSVTKWIHLNYCDDGLRRFFKRVYNHLKPDGLFILEAQPIDNYSRRKRTSDRLKANFYSIKFKPEDFDSYLLNDVGFRQIIYESKTEHECKGFKRPIKVFQK